MPLYSFWSQPICGWSFDDFQSFRDRLGSTSFDQYVRNYKNSFDDNNIGGLIFDLPINFNLGGKEEKIRLKATDKPLGVFDFSLASKGLYKVQEYYSKELAQEKPKLFLELNLPSGIVPPDLVKTNRFNGKVFYTFTDIDGKTYNLIQQQKGTAAVESGVPNAKKQFATTTKKVYLKFNRQGGKVKYVEIYSLFYYTRGGGDDFYAIAHFPAFQVAEYFESRGIGVRIYMTRFVVMSKNINLREFDIRTNTELPLYQNSRTKTSDDWVFIQPIQVKDFYQEVDYEQIFSVSSVSQSDTLYENIAKLAMEEEIIRGNRIYPFGSPDWQQIQYMEAFERYKNKYATYVKLGIWKSKEVVGEGQMFFHSISIKNYLDDFRYSFSRNYVGSTFYDKLSQSQVGTKFFEFWMKICGLRLKHIILLQVSQNIRKDLQSAIDESKDTIEEIKYFLESKSTTVTYAKDLYNMAQGILRDESYPITGNFDVNYKGYIVNILQDAQIYAQRGYFPTPEDEIEKREDRILQVLDELNNL